MKVTVVGTSCTWFKRKNTSFVIDDDIIFDMPEGSYKDIIKLIDIFKTKAVLISHLHSDHCLNLHVVTTRHIRENHGRTEALKVYCPKGTLERLIEMNKMFYSGKDECDASKYEGFVEFVYLEDGMTFKVGEYTVTAYKMEHGLPETYGFTFTDTNGMTVGFSADTRVCDNLHNILNKSKFAFVEMAAVQPHHAHVCTNEFVELVNEHKDTKIYPVHTSDAAQEFAEKNGLNYLQDGQVLEFLS